MPTTLLGLAVLVGTVVPGLGYQLGRESRHPTRKLAGFRQTASLIFAGIIATTVAMYLFALVRWALPTHTPDVGLLLRTPSSYLGDQLLYVATWATGIVTAATAGAFLVGRYAPKPTHGVTFESSWWKAFKLADQYKTYVGCELTDGTHVAGTLWTYSTSVEETEDRDIGLVAPITYRTDEGTATTVLDDVGLVIVNAARIKFLTITYLDTPQPTTPDKT